MAASDNRCGETYNTHMNMLPPNHIFALDYDK
jgi:hypothetical protein